MSLDPAFQPSLSWWGGNESGHLEVQSRPMRITDLTSANCLNAFYESRQSISVVCRLELFLRSVGDNVRPLEEDRIESHAYLEESIELSRRFRALKLWFSLM